MVSPKRNPAEGNGGVPDLTHLPERQRKFITRLDTDPALAHCRHVADIVVARLIERAGR